MVEDCELLDQVAKLVGSWQLQVLDVHEGCFRNHVAEIRLVDVFERPGHDHEEKRAELMHRDPLAFCFCLVLAASRDWVFKCFHQADRRPYGGRANRDALFVSGDPVLLPESEERDPDHH